MTTTQAQEAVTCTQQRQGVLVEPQKRLAKEQLELIDSLSRDLLENPGVMCHNVAAVEAFREVGAQVEQADGCARIRIPSRIIDSAIETAPSRIVLGARKPENRLVLDARQPRVRFGTGSETNVWLDVQYDGNVPRFVREPGSIERLRQSAHLCDQLENVDFFIRNVNIRDAGIDEHNKDVNQFFTSLNHISKHVQAGLTSLAALDDVIRLGQVVAGGVDVFAREPVISFITCVIKSPLQFVDDTTEKLIEISKRRVPVVISSCPMGGATGPFDELGMVAQINAELLAGIALNQIIAPGTAVLYGAVPVRTRLDNLNDMYAAAEFVHYNVDCAQMARYYGLPCYSSAGVGDASVPGIQATIEKMLTLSNVPQAGAQYIHYAFGLLERTNVFCPEQAILDDAQIDLVKRTLERPSFAYSDREEVLSLVREIMATSHKTYMYHIPLPSRDAVYARFPLESEQGSLYKAYQRREELLNTPYDTLPSEIQKEIVNNIPNLLEAAQ